MSDSIKISQRDLGQMMSWVKRLINNCGMGITVAQIVQESLALEYELPPIRVV